jgi:hypothetical protein
MNEITLGQIQNWMVFLIAFIGAIFTIVKAVKNAISQAFEPINKRMDEIDMNATKNFLVQSLTDIDRNGFVDGVSKARLYEQYEHYQKLGGNSYIKDEFDRLKKQNKI